MSFAGKARIGRSRSAKRFTTSWWKAACFYSAPSSRSSRTGRKADQRGGRQVAVSDHVHSFCRGHAAPAQGVSGGEIIERFEQDKKWGREATLYGYVQQYFAWLDGRSENQFSIYPYDGAFLTPIRCWTIPNCGSTMSCSGTFS